LKPIGGRNYHDGVRARSVFLTLVEAATDYTDSLISVDFLGHASTNMKNDDHIPHFRHLLVLSDGEPDDMIES